jgi:DNA uptake protein ComE-like DNA-binding protein
LRPPRSDSTVHFPLPQGILPDGKIEINLADTLAWQTVKGIGSARAKIIVRRREKLGYFDSPDNLCLIRGVDSIYDAQPDRFVVSDSILKRLKDSLGEPKLERNSYRRKTGPPAARPPATTRVSVAAKIDLNAADAAALEALPGIGDVLSARIVKFRNLLGGFYSIEQLKEVYGLREEHFQKCAPHLNVVSPPYRKIAVNSVPHSVLKKHPYFKEYADSIVALRPLDSSRLKKLMRGDYQRAHAYVEWD